MTRRPARGAPASSRDAVSIALVVSALAWIAVSFSHVTGAWGLDTLRHVPSVFGLWVLATLALTLMPAAAKRLRAVVGALGDALAAQGPLPCTLLALAMFALLLLPRDPLHFVGDSGLR
ncbi:MAG: hypothetical protein ABIU54_11065, partial [Candidatus Eisenbacteria bacterium]